MQRKSKNVPTLLLLGLLMTLSACSPKLASSETSTAICTAWQKAMPQFSRKDTQETLEMGAREVEVYNAICGN